MTIAHAYVDTPLGELLLVASRSALVGLYFPGHWYPPSPATIGERAIAAHHRILAHATVEIDEYLEAGRRTFDVPVATSGSALSERVWGRLRTIPYGTTVTYGQIAAELGQSNLAQRVGQAVAHNPISIIIPCHRVVGADGSLTGFAGGIDRKRHLLRLEEPDSTTAQRLF